MSSVATSRRISAIAALVAAGGAAVIAVVALIQRPVVLLATLACLSIAIGAALYALTRTGVRRTAGTLVAIVAFVAPIVIAVAAGGALLPIVFLLLVVLAAGAAR